MNNRLKSIGWSDLQLKIPSTWECLVKGTRQLLFEEDFVPQLQLRWENVILNSPQAIKTHTNRFWDKAGTYSLVNPQDKSNSNRLSNFDTSWLYRNEDSKLAGGICYDTSSHNLLVFQILSPKQSTFAQIEDVLSSVQWRRDSDAEALWQIQDLRFKLCPSFVLKDYSFQAGLTRIGFQGSDYQLQTCKLAPADHRLQNQTLSQLLTVLCDTEKLDLHIDQTGCYGLRTPSILKQILFRFKRQPPFIRAKIWHETGSNRLLALVLTSKKYITEQDLQKHCLNYEIF